MVMFHSYVSLPEGILYVNMYIIAYYIYIYVCSFIVAPTTSQIMRAFTPWLYSALVINCL